MCYYDHAVALKLQLGHWSADSRRAGEPEWKMSDLPVSQGSWRTDGLVRLSLTKFFAGLATARLVVLVAAA